MKRIPFKPEMVRAIMAGTKTETRRLLNPQPPEGATVGFSTFCARDERGICTHIEYRRYSSQGGDHQSFHKLPYRVNDIVGVAEPWFMQNSLNAYSGKELIDNGWQSPMFYADYLSESDLPLLRGRYRQARFLPDAFVRTRLRILSVEAQRLQEITEEQAILEGVEEREGDPGFYAAYPQSEEYPGWLNSPIASFQSLWDSIHGQPSRDSKGNVTAAQPWASNPWVWRYRFEVVDRKAV